MSIPATGGSCSAGRDPKAFPRRAFGVSMERLMRMQNNFDIAQAHRREGEIKVARCIPKARATSKASLREAETMTGSTIHQPDPKLDLVLERIVDVPRELVWMAWTAPEHLKKWFTPGHGQR
jgi:Activator of Hsp90 ATPase homolog 1-like protein